MKRVFGQFLAGAIILAGALAVWINYVPSAMPILQKSGITALLGIEMQAPAGQGAEGGGRRGGGPVSVVTASVGTAFLNDRISAIGDGRAVRSVAVRSDADGVIEELRFRSGARVNQGDVILRIEDEAERIALERARLVLTNTQDELERFTRLQGAGTVSGVQFRAAELALKTDELAVREAEFQLDRRIVRAPISGWIGLLDVEEGSRLSSQADIAVIGDRSQILVEFRVPERFVGRIAIGTEIAATPLFDPTLTLTGVVSAIDNQIDRTSRSLRVEGLVDNKDDLLRAGMAFSITMSFAGDSYPSIDPLALQWSSEGSFVWAVRDGKAVRVPVAIKQRNSGSVLVDTELEPGEQIVTEGVQNLRPGSAVKPSVQPSAQVLPAAVIKSPSDT